ncbi:putative dna glycosylase [Diaporthe ampelina]|uniref:Putative dna glycosylase n=1 Tax=Diaporthe ampelina TaxID=1214573 RepID=A0A0G2FL89_9PEZI|nr:putative dna glycosylase [Diaporthe ampelina]
MEAVVNGSFAAKRPSAARSTTLDADAARDLLNYFEIDENEKEFLISAITSSKAHEDEVKALLHDRAFSSHTSEDDTSEDDDSQNDNAPTGRHSIPWRTPENPEAPPMDENTARNLLCGFNIDDDLREFLMAVIMSGKVFEDDLRQLYKIGLSAGWETFQAQVQCAKSLRDKVLARHYGDDLTVYLGLMMRESGHITDFKERYWPLGAPALNSGDKLVAGKHLWGGLVDGNTTSLQSIQLVHDDDSQVNNIVPMDKHPPDWVASNPQPTKTSSDTSKKAKTKTQSIDQAPSSVNDARFEVVCPIRRQDGSICNKRCYDGKAYRSMQEHIRKVHKDHYIPGLNANEESFRRMVNNTPGAESNLPQQATNGAKGPDGQAGGFSSQLVRPADLSLPLANGATADAGKHQRVAKKAKQSHDKSLAKSPFFVDQGLNLMDVNVSGAVPGMIPAQSALGGAFDERQFLPQFDSGQDGFGAMALGLDATISQSLFPQHVDGVAHDSMSSDRKRKRDNTNPETQDQSSSQDPQCGLTGSNHELYNPPVDPNLFFQTLPPQPAAPIAADVFDEMIDILGQLQEASQENNGTREMSGPTAGHYNPPAESTTSQALLAKRNPFAVPTTPAKVKPAQKQAASHFFVSPSKKIDEARTAAVTPSPSAKKTSRPARGTVSALPIPPLAGDRFGLVQEELAADPFRLLVAVTFLIRTPGRVAIPVFRQLMERYPTAQALVEADPADIEAMMHHLGLSNQRTKTIQKYARTWLERAPSKDVRYGIKDYPQKGDGKDVRAGEVFGPEDHPETDKGDGVIGSPDSSKENDPQTKTAARGHGTAWEIGHLTTGRYALDSWRIFCRDVLLGRAQDWKGKGRDGLFQPEWMRVLPEDKELRACLRWMWMREGWEWDPKTGEKTPLREEMRRAVDEGRVAYDNQGQLQILAKAGVQVDGNAGA